MAEPSRYVTSKPGQRVGTEVVARLLGDEMFEAIAADHAADCPPRQPVLALYGTRFPDWLEEQGWIEAFAYLDAKGGRSTIRFNKAFNELNTGRSGIITSFSSAGPTAFGHELKPDLAAPGGQILSSTLPEAAGEPFAVFDGTSMSAPHVTGAVATRRLT